MMTDNVSDMLARMKNALLAGHPNFTVPHSKLKENIVKTFISGGFVESMDTVGEGYKKQLVVNFKKISGDLKVIRGLKRISTPGMRVYIGADEIKHFKGGFGMSVISTSKGVMSDVEAKKRGLGGEFICSIW